MNEKTKLIVKNAIIAAIYAALTLILAPISYGPIQLRLSEILILLALLSGKFVPGLLVGCIIANAFSPMGIWDVLFGTLGTLLSGISLWLIGKKIRKTIPALLLSILAASFWNGLFVGFEIFLTLRMSLLLYGGYVFLSELVVLFAGGVLYYFLEKQQLLQKLLR